MTQATTDPAGDQSRSTRFISSIRLRLLLAFVAILALATAGSVIVVRAILIHRLDERIDSDLVQEARELQRLSKGNDPDTGRPFEGRVKRIFEVFLERNIPTRYEAQITFVGGKPFLRSRPVVPYRLDKDPELVARWANLNASRRGRVETPAGTVDYLAVPIRNEDRTKGVFVVAIFHDLAQQDTNPAIAGAAGVGIVILLIGSVLAWTVADRILGPVSKVTRLARSIGETDLRRRIEVTSADEIGRLALTFNEMLDRLEAAFDAQRRLVDDAGHELRTPITIIQGQLDVMGDDPEDRRKTIEVIQDELDRMSRFVHDLLLLSRAERADFLNLQTVDVARLTDELYSKAETLANRSWSVDEVGRGKIVADRQRLTQAMMQLAQNATQFTSEEKEIFLGSVVQNGEVRLWVRDTGPGVAPSEQEQIFERFRRGAKPRTRSESAGLGLSIVKAIAEAHHGRVEVSSQPGRGSTFTLVLPVDQPVPPTDDSL